MRCSFSGVWRMRPGARSLFCCLVLVYGTLGNQGPAAFAAPPAPPPPLPPGVRVVAVGGVTNRRPNQGFLHFGSTHPNQRPFIEQNFILQNDTALPLVLDRLDLAVGGLGSLGLSAFFAPGGPNKPLPILGAGKQATLHVKLDLRDLPPGLVLKGVQVFAVGNSVPLATLYLTGVRLPDR